MQVTPTMRPILLPSSVAVLALLPHLGQAQGLNRSAIGIKGGVQWCRLGANDVAYSSVPGGLVGVYAPFLVRQRLEIQPELLVSYQGSDLLIPEAPPVSTRMLYVQLPVTVKVFLSNAFNLQAGPQVGYCAVAWQQGETSEGLVRQFDAGLFGGLGVGFRNGLDLSVRYNYGMRPVFTVDNGVNPRNRIIQASVGYRMARMGGRQHRLRRR